MNDAAQATQVAPPFVPGYFPDMPAEVYHAIECMSSGGAAKMLRSPAHFRLARDTPNEPSAVMQFGSATHIGVLEPSTYASRVAASPKFDKRTTIGKSGAAEFEAANAGKIVLSASDAERVMRCVDSVLSHPAASKLLAGGVAESSQFWFDAKYKVPCKSRVDCRNHGGLIDLKTTADASPEAFARSAANFLYHVQAAHYISGDEHVHDRSPEFYAFIVVESEAPFACACYTLPGAAVLAGAHLMNRALDRYADALAAGRWQGYADTISPLALPRWALRFDN